MGRRGDHSFADFQALVLSAAKDVVVTAGVEGLSVRKIVAKIGYSAGALYNAFSGLEEVIMHLNVDTLDELIGFIKEAADSSMAGIAGLKSIAYSYLDYKKQNEELWSLLFEYPLNQISPVWYDAKIKELFDVMKDFITQKVGGMSAQNIAILWAAIHGICLLESKGKFAKIGVSQNAYDMISMLIDNYGHAITNH
jgi:AcrR family transcriptional regulator